MFHEPEYTSRRKFYLRALDAAGNISLRSLCLRINDKSSTDKTAFPSSVLVFFRRKFLSAPLSVSRKTMFLVYCPLIYWIVASVREFTREATISLVKLESWTIDFDHETRHKLMRCESKYLISNDWRKTGERMTRTCETHARLSEVSMSNCVFWKSLFHGDEKWRFVEKKYKHPR